MLKGEAGCWAKRIDVRTFKNLKREFLLRYWRLQTQSRILDYNFDGTYDPKNEISLETCFSTWASLVRSLFDFQGEINFNKKVRAQSEINL